MRAIHDPMRQIDARRLDEFFGQVVDEFSDHQDLVNWFNYLQANENWKWFKTKKKNALLRLPKDGEYQWRELNIPGGETISDDIHIGSRKDLEDYLQTH